MNGQGGWIKAIKDFFRNIGRLFSDFWERTFDSELTIKENY